MAVKMNTNDERRTTNDDFGRVGVLMGGLSSEREISLKSGRAVYESLKQLNLEVIAIDIKAGNIKEIIDIIKSYKIDCAFLALHGHFGEDGQIQEVLDKLKIPYTSPGASASRLAMDKVTSRRIFEIYGIPVPKYKVINRFSYNRNCQTKDSLRLPWVVKPANHGSSIGLTIVDKEDDLDKAVSLAFSFDETILIEEYIKGREVTVGILGKCALPVIEIIPKKRFFDYEAKYTAGMTDYVVPAKLEKETAKKIQDTALRAYKLLGCAGCSRVDMILSEDNIPFVLEVNTIPGLTKISLLPKAAKAVGIEFSQLCLRLIKLAYERSLI